VHSAGSSPSDAINPAVIEYPGKRYEEWIVDDPAGQNLQAVRRIRDEIDRRVQSLVGKLTA
jgi:protein-tyrosine-phosphatase